MHVQSWTHVPCIVCHMLHVLIFEDDYLFSGQSVLWNQMGATACPLFLTKKTAIMHWSEPKFYNKLFLLLHSWDFGFWSK